MTDNQKLMGGLLKLKETDQDGYLAMHAIFHAATGSESMPMPEGYSRGTLKRAIRRIRALKAEMEKDPSRLCTLFGDSGGLNSPGLVT